MILHYATVKEVVGSRFKVQFVGDHSPSPVIYPYLASYTNPQVGDKVAIVEDKYGKKLIQGKVVW